MKVRWMIWIAAFGLLACKNAKVGVSKKAVEDKIQSAFAKKGLTLTEVRCPEGPLSGQVECTGVSPEGLEAPIVVNIQRDGFLSHDLDFKTRDVAVGSVVSDMVAKMSQEKYGVALEVKCPTFTKETEVMTCEGTFEGATIGVEYQNGGWKTTKGIITADAVGDVLARMAAERNLGVDRAQIDCSGQKVYGLAPKREITCRAADRVVTLAVDDDADGVHVVRDEPATP